jgi:inhibitor of KinA sporulation pathway (predicted exonuclease)
LDKPPGEYRHLVVLDFEWTCDNRKPVHPRAEIIEFSCVLVSTLPRPATIVAQFQQYVKPEHNPILTKFCTELTGITTRMIDDVGVPLKTAIARFHTWLEDHNSIEKSRIESLSSSSDRPRQREKFVICTWSDADLGMTLPRQMEALGLCRTPWFDRWINLKLSFASVYKKSSSGLKNCVESIGLTFEGRAHSGLVDSINTAHIVLDMLNKQNFTFQTCTRFLDDQWEMIGSKRSNEKRAKRE